MTCATDTCAASDCCEANPTCNNTDGSDTTFQQLACPLDHTIKAVLIDVVCATETCLSADCCVSNAKCSSVLSTVTTFCASGELVSNAASVTCGGVVCTKSNDGEKCCRPVTTTTTAPVAATSSTPSSVSQEFISQDSLGTASMTTADINSFTTLMLLLLCLLM